MEDLSHFNNISVKDGNATVFANGKKSTTFFKQSNGEIDCRKTCSLLKKIYG